MKQVITLFFCVGFNCLSVVGFKCRHCCVILYLFWFFENDCKVTFFFDICKYFCNFLAYFIKNHIILTFHTKNYAKVLNSQFPFLTSPFPFHRSSQAKHHRFIVLPGAVPRLRLLPLFPPSRNCARSGAGLPGCLRVAAL